MSRLSKFDVYLSNKRKQEEDGPVTTIHLTPHGEITIKQEPAKPTWTKEGYAEYLKSKYWKKLRSKKIQAASRAGKYECGICGSKSRLEVHHLNYKNIYDVEIYDLRILCRRCHGLTHEVKRTQKIYKFRQIKAAVKNMICANAGGIL